MFLAPNVKLLAFWHTAWGKRMSWAGIHSTFISWELWLTASLKIVLCSTASSGLTQYMAPPLLVFHAMWHMTSPAVPTTWKMALRKTTSSITTWQLLCISLIDCPTMTMVVDKEASKCKPSPAALCRRMPRPWAFIAPTPRIGGLAIPLLVAFRDFISQLCRMLWGIAPPHIQTTSLTRWSCWSLTRTQHTLQDSFGAVVHACMWVANFGKTTLALSSTAISLVELLQLEWVEGSS